MKSEDEKSSLLGGDKPAALPSQMADEMRASGGARPKVRSPKEVKTRRFVVKQVKAMSRTQLLESVSESDEGAQPTLLQSSLDSPDHRSQKSSRCPEFFGVKSYVHTFYEAMAMDSPQAYENTGYSSINPIPLRKRRRNNCLKITVWLGVVFLVVGFVALLVGFLVTKRNAMADVQEGIAVINQDDLSFNRNIDACKIAGIVIFCTGGIITTAMLLLHLLFIRRQRTEDDNLNQVIRVVNEEEEEEEERPPKTPMEAKVPVTEEIASVQPRRSHPEEVVMTNAGLCKVPSS